MTIELSPFQTKAAIFVYVSLDELPRLPEPAWMSREPCGEVVVEYPRDDEHRVALALCGLKVEES